MTNKPVEIFALFGLSLRIKEEAGAIKLNT